MPEEALLYEATSAVARVGQKIRTGLVPAPGVSSLNSITMREYGARTLPIYVIGQKLRDDWWQKFPVLPSLVSSFVQVAVSREWTITGKPRVASRALERLNTAAYVDWYGQLYEGWSQFSARRIIDWLMLGVNGMIVPNGLAPIQYVDPMEVQHTPRTSRPRVLTSRTVPEWTDYTYNSAEWSNRQIFFNYYLPYGYIGAVMAPLIPAVPLARLLYLVEQHDMASVDGRKIKDIFLVADDNVSDALTQALQNYVSMQTGEFDPEKHGIPIVAMNKRGGFSEGEKVADSISLLGISQIPEGLDRAQLYDFAAVEFSALTGMQVTEWWHIKTGANNRATERVNQERGRTKGPNFYCRQDQRFINNSGILGNAHFAYVEEVDIQAQKDKAEVMLRLSEAVKNLQEAVGMAISPRSLIRWLQQMGVFPTDDYLIDDIIMLNEDPVKPSDMVDRPIEDILADQEREDREKQIEREMEDAELAAEKQRLLIEAQQEATSDEEAETEAEAEAEDEDDERETEAARSILRLVHEIEYSRALENPPIPEYGHVRLNQDGNVIEYRRPVYPVLKMVEREVREELLNIHVTPQDLEDVASTVFSEVDLTAIKD